MGFRPKRGIFFSLTADLALNMRGFPEALKVGLLKGRNTS